MHLENQDPANRTCGHIVNVGKAKRDKVLVPAQVDWLAKLKAIKAAAEATGVDLVIIARTDSIDGALPGQVVGRRADGDRGCVGSGGAGLRRDLARVQQRRAGAAAAFAEGVRKYYPNQMLGFNLSPSLYFGQGEEGRHPDHQPAAGRPGLSPCSSRRCSTSAPPAWPWRRGCGSSLPKGLDALADLQIEEDERRGRRADHQDAPEVRRA